MSCSLEKQTVRMTDTDGSDVWDRSDFYQKIRNIEHSRIGKHFKDLTEEEEAHYETCDWHYHWKHVGRLTGKNADRSFSEYITGLCLDWVEKNPKAAEASRFKAAAVLDPWLKLEIAHVDQPAFAAARKFKNSIFYTLIINGACGYGKTTLARAVMGDYTRAGLEAYLVTCERMAETFLNAQPSVNEIDREARQAIIDMKKADLLVLDDLGTAEKEYSEFFKERLKQLLDEKQGKLIVTTNLTREQMETKFNDKIVSRIFEKSKVVTLRGKDYRRRAW